MRGFTLVETVVAAGIALVVGTLLVSILVSHNGLFYKQNSIVNEGLGLNDTMAEINNNIRGAVQVSAGYPESSPDFLSGTDILVLKLPAISSSGTIDSIYDYLVVAKDTDNPKILRLQLFPNVQSIRESRNSVLTTLLDSVRFEYLDKNGTAVEPTAAASVSVSLTILSKSGSVSSGRTSTSKTTLRNFMQ